MTEKLTSSKRNAELFPSSNISLKNILQQGSKNILSSARNGSQRRD